MKKVLSILLSVLMLAGCFVSMIPAANAATSRRNETIEDPTVVPSVTKGELVYSQDFEGEGLTDAEGTALSGKDLTSSLGWGGALNGKNTVEAIEEEGNHALVLKAYTSAFKLTFLENELLAGGDYVVEYTQKLTENREDQDGSFGVLTGGNGSNSASPDTVVSALVQEQGETLIEAAFPGQKIDDLTTEIFDFAKNRTNYENADGSAKRRFFGSTFGETIKFRMVVDSTYGVSVWKQGAEDTDWVLIAYADLATNLGKLNWQKNATVIPADVMFSISKGMAIQLDDIAVYKIQRDGEQAVPGFGAFATPSLIVSEVVAQSGKGELAGETPVAYSHGWIEVYNASASALNLYDYAIAREEGVAINNMYSGIVEEKDLFYVLPGANTITAGGQTRSFENPAYEDGVLLPGAAAILFVPLDWFNETAPTHGTVETFKELDLAGTYGLTEEKIAKLKIFTVCSEYNLGLGTDTNDLLAVSPIDAETKTAKVLGHNITDHDYVVSISADFKGGKNAYVAFDGMGCNGYGPKQFFSNEITFIDENGEYVGHGLVDKELRPDAKKGTNYATPGVLPPKNAKKIQMVIMTGMILEEDVTDQLYLNTEYVPIITPADTLTHKFVGWADAEGNVMQTLEGICEIGGEDVVLTAVYETELPEFAGYQITETVDGKYDLRIVATVDRVDSAALGMKINFKYNNGKKDVYGSKEYYCRFVYEEISENYGTGTVTAEAYDANYLVVFHIEDCPADIVTEYTITTFTVFEDETGLRTTAWSEDSFTFTPAA